MVLVQVFLNATSQFIDLQLTGGKYNVKLVSCQYQYSAADSVIFGIQFRSPWTMQNYGNCRYLQVNYPNAHHAQINGDIVWETQYMGAFTMDLVDVTTGIAPVGTHFTEAMLWFDVEKIE
jgi:hypothetical protein